MASDIQLPLVSIIITNFNYETYVSEALESCWTQDYPDIEVIFVDDASTDGSVPLVERAIALGANVRIIRRLANGGQGLAMLDGFRASSGDFICFLDADDVLFPKFVGTHVYTHLALPWQIAFTSSDLVHIGASRRIMTSTSGNLRHTFLNTLAEGDFKLTLLRIAPKIDDALNPHMANIQRCIYLPSSKAGYHWAACSGLFFKRAAVEQLAVDDVLRHVRISADFYWTLAHFFNGSAVIDAKLGGYRIHGKNGFSGEVQLDGIDTSHRMPDDLFPNILRLFARLITDTQLERYSRLMGPKWLYPVALQALQRYSEIMNKPGGDSRFFAHAIMDRLERFSEVIGRDFTIYLLREKLGVNEEELRQRGFFAR